VKPSILDFDLDYFLFPPIHYPAWAQWLNRNGQPASKRIAWNRKYHFWMTHGTFRSRMRELGVPPIPHRRQFEHHQEAIPFWLELVHSGKISVPFRVYHFDAHSDLFLTRAEEADSHFTQIDRLHELQATLPDLIHEANYLWWAIYLGLTDEIVWIVPEPQFRRDLQVELDGPFVHFAPNRDAQKHWEDQARDAWSEAFLAKLGGKKQEARAHLRDHARYADMAMAARYERPFILKRFGMEVPVRVTTLSCLEALSNPVAINLCRSPDYTPAKADRFFDGFLAQFA
jgi:hypothetical protein